MGGGGGGGAYSLPGNIEFLEPSILSLVKSISVMPYCCKH